MRRPANRRASGASRDPVDAYLGNSHAASWRAASRPAGSDDVPRTSVPVTEPAFLTGQELELLRTLTTILKGRIALAEAHGILVHRRGTAASQTVNDRPQSRTRCARCPRR